jgi:hypothetical protein
MNKIFFIGILFFASTAFAKGIHFKLSHGQADSGRWRHRPRLGAPVGVFTNRRQFEMHPATVPSITEVRILYQKAPFDENSCKELVEILSAFTEKNNPLYLGYKASGTMMMAKHVMNPFSKLSYFNKGKKMLELAIEADRKNIELRFLRFEAQTHIPSFLGYKENIEEDKKFLLDSFSKITDKALNDFMRPALLKSGYLTASEKQQLK